MWNAIHAKISCSNFFDGNAACFQCKILVLLVIYRLKGRTVCRIIFLNYQLRCFDLSIDLILVFLELDKTQ